MRGKVCGGFGPKLPQWVSAALPRAGRLGARIGPHRGGTFSMKLLLRFLGFLFAAGTIVFVVGVCAVAGLLWHFSKDLPDYSQLQDYEPPVMTRVHAADGSLLAEYAKERRLYLPIQAVPKLVINAFIAAEDKNFYEHGGLDFYGIARAVILYVQNYGGSRRPQGASTITQQVAKNFLLSSELSIDAQDQGGAARACASSATYSKDKILELYLNEIYLGFGAYGVAAASLLYFDKSVHELTVAEAAYLAALPKGPNNYNPFRRHDEAIARRNYVIDRMVEDGYIAAADGDKAKKEPLNVTVRPTGARIFAAEYFAEEVRRYIYRELRREEALRGRPLGAHHARSQAAGAGAQDHDQRARQFRRAARLSRPGRQDRHQRRLGRQARRREVAVGYRSVAARRRARSQRSVGAHRPAAGARSRRQRGQGARSRHRAARRRQMGEAGERIGKADPAREPGARRRRRHLCRADEG